MSLEKIRFPKLACATALAITIGSLALLQSRAAQATEVGYGRNLGLGFELGDPTGFAAKYWVGRTNAIDAGFGFYGYGFGLCNNRGCGGNQSFSINVDYLWQSNLIRSTAQLDWHIGAGGRTIIWNNGGNPNGNGNVALGARMPIGVDLMFNNPGFLEVFLELAPILYVAPGAFFSIEAGLGVRLYF